MNRKNLIFQLLAILLFWQVNLYAQEVNLSTPRATIFTHIENLKPNNYHPEIAAKVIYGLPVEEAQSKAIKLKYIFDGKGVFIDYNDFPSNEDYLDSIHSPIPAHVFKPFPYRLPNIYLEKYGKNWYYSKKTIASIDYMYNEIYPFGADLLVQYVPSYFKYKILGLQLWQWLGLLLVILITYFLHILFKKILYQILKVLKKRFLAFPVENFDEKLKQFAHPLSYIFGIYVMMAMLPYLLLGQKVGNWMMAALEFALIVFWIFVFLKLINIFIAIFKHRAKKTENSLDDQLVPILQNTLKSIVIIFGIFKFLIIMGADPKAILAGLSIGGLALGLAAQDTVKNLIGSIMIFIDKPFKIGDWISVNGIEGSVEEVGFRSSIIRAADTSVFKIPNSLVSEAAVNNKGKRIYRRYTTTLGVRYDTPPELIEIFVEGIKQLIELHPTTRNYSKFTPYNSVPYNVEFIDYADSSLNILLNVYFVTHDYAEEMHGRHVLLLGILELANSIGVQFAFPSQTLFMEMFPEKKSEMPTYNTNPKDVDMAMKAVFEKFKTKITKY